MRVAIVGGGPGGLYLAGLLRERVPSAEVVVYERNRPHDTFGFGVVFSEPTLRNLHDQDRVGFDALFGGAVRWPGIDIRVKGELWRCEGNGFAAIERRRLLDLLADRARRAGVELHYETELTPGSPELADADVVVVANGANSVWRTANAERLQATVETASAKFIWFATTKVFDGMTFLFEENDHGWFAVHAYPYNNERSTFVVETDERTWRAAGLDGFDVSLPPGPSDEASAAYVQRLFAEHLDGGTMVLNNSRWANFRTVRTPRWRLDERTVLLGDAAHTAHFSVGSGTKMAMEDALDLAGRLAEVDAGVVSLDAALNAFGTERLGAVLRIQDAARPSLSWWEHFGEYAQMPPAQFAFHFLTRSGQVGLGRLRRSDPSFVDRSLTEQLGDPGGSVLARPLAGLDGRTVSGRLVGLKEDIAEGPSAGPRIVQLDDGLRATWWRAPARPEDVEGLVRDHQAHVNAVSLALVDSATGADGSGDRSGVRLAQHRLAEVLRLRHGRAVALIRRDCTADEAASLILSGRADLVAVPGSRVAELLEEEPAAR